MRSSRCKCRCVFSPSMVSWPSVGGWESSVRKPEACTGLKGSLGRGLELLLLSIFGWYVSDSELWLLFSSGEEDKTSTVRKLWSHVEGAGSCLEVFSKWTEQFTHNNGFHWRKKKKHVSEEKHRKKWLSGLSSQVLLLLWTMSHTILLITSH